MKMIDLDKLFEEYMTGYIKENLGKMKPEEIEENVHELYEKWIDEKNDVLKMTPNEYLVGLKKEGKLVEYIEELLKSNVELSDLAGDACGEDEIDGLVRLFYKYPDYQSALLAILKNIEVENENLENLYVELLLHSEDESLYELAIEALSVNHPNAVDKINAEYDKLDEDRRQLVLDVLYRYPGNDLTYKRLISFFKIGENIPLFTDYLGYYGDVRAIDELITYAKTNPLRKYEFVEIRNAVERLGGDMPAYNYEILE